MHSMYNKAGTHSRTSMSVHHIKDRIAGSTLFTDWPWNAYCTVRRVCAIITRLPIIAFLWGQAFDKRASKIEQPPEVLNFGA